MKQIVITRNGGPEVLKIIEKPDPPLNSDQLQIRVKASGINFADILTRKGYYPDAPPKPCVIGYEVAGIVEKVGSAIDDNLLGKSVIALTRFGGYSDVVTVPAINILPKPNALSFEEAAAIPVNYLTAYQLLVVMGGLKKGESILIHNAGGGVGLAALDFAKKIGAITYGTASSQKHMFLMKRGFDYAIDYRTQDWLQVVRQLSGYKGVEMVIDSLGGANWKKSYKALRHTGRLGVFGLSTITEPSIFGKLKILKTILEIPKFNPTRLMNGNKGIFGVNIGHLWHEGPKVKEWFNTILEGVNEGWIRPYVDRTFHFDEVANAHRYIEERKNIGKVILIP